MAKQEKVKYTGNLKECCGPLLIWLRLIGIPMMISNASQSFRFFVISYGVLLFLATIGNSILTIYWVITQIQELSKIEIPGDVTSTYKWSFSLEICNQMFTTVGTQLGLLIYSFASWPKLLDIFTKIEKHSLLTIREYRKARKIFKIGLTVLLLVRRI